MEISFYNEVKKRIQKLSPSKTQVEMWWNLAISFPEKNMKYVTDHLFTDLFIYFSFAKFHTLKKNAKSKSSKISMGQGWKKLILVWKCEHKCFHNPYEGLVNSNDMHCSPSY